MNNRANNVGQAGEVEKKVFGTTAKVYKRLGGPDIPSAKIFGQQQLKWIVDQAKILCKKYLSSSAGGSGGGQGSTPLAGGDNRPGSGGR